MRLLIVGLGLLALVVGGLSTYLIKTFYSEEQIVELEKRALPKVTRVLVAVREIRQGDPLSRGNIAWQVWGLDNVNPRFISVNEPSNSTEESDKQMDSYVNQVARRTFSAGEPISGDKVFKPEGASFMSGLLRRGTRAVAIPTTVATAVGGFILPGDYVDVLLTHKLAGEVEKERKRSESRRKNAGGFGTQKMTVVSFATETIVRGARVVAVDQAHDSPEGKALVSKSVTLEVTPKQAEVLTAGMAMGKLSLSLRSLGASAKDDTDVSSFTTDVEVSPLLSKLGGQRAASTSTRKRKTTSNGQVIQIYRGGGATTQEITVR